MVNYESPPEDNPELINVQWYHDAGVGRGVSEETAEELGYIPPQPRKQIEITAETPQPEPPARTTNHHPGRRTQKSKRSPAQSAEVRKKPGYDKGGSKYRLEANAFSPNPPRLSEVAQKARQIIDGETNHAPDQS